MDGDQSSRHLGTPEEQDSAFVCREPAHCIPSPSRALHGLVVILSIIVFCLVPLIVLFLAG